MTIEIRTVIRYEYKCELCSQDYTEQRNLGEDAYFTKCTTPNCNGNFQLINQTESTYEQIIPDPVVVIEPTE
jgi:predicted SprT family Zn-dependent metalloprotease